MYSRVNWDRVSVMQWPLLSVGVFECKLGQSDCDVVVVLKLDELHCVERYVCEHHEILT